jgi:hypothetical protein
MVALYSLATWIGLARHGHDAWLAYADPFARAFALLGTFASLGRDERGRIVVRDYAAALRRPDAVPGDAAAVGYRFAHSFAYLLVQGQVVIALASDPLGWGWNLLGTRDHAIDAALVGARLTWHVAFAAIVLGHAISVYVAHVLAERALGSRRDALRALLSFTALMILYTVISLQILAEPLVRYSGPQETTI